MSAETCQFCHCSIYWGTWNDRPGKAAVEPLLASRQAWRHTDGLTMCRDAESYARPALPVDSDPTPPHGLARVLTSQAEARTPSATD